MKTPQWMVTLRRQAPVLSSGARTSTDGDSLLYRLQTVLTWLQLGQEVGVSATLEAVVGEVEELAVEAAVGQDNHEMIVATEVLEFLTRRDDLTADQISRLFAAYVREQDRNLTGNWNTDLGPNWRRHNVEQSLAELLQRPVCSVSLVGTAWRSLHAYLKSANSMAGWKASMKVNSLVAANPNTPATVTARILMSAGKPYITTPAWTVQVGRDFPDLADLPLGMLLETVASQPTPAEWFVDVFPTPEGVTVLEPSTEPLR